LKLALSLKFEVQEKSIVDDGRGGSTITWSTVFRLIGKMKALQGYEQIRAQMLEKKITHRIETWYDSRLTTAHRLVAGSRIFDILFIENINERNHKMKITVGEKNA
jgi:SPP1 family predicted phage head-tail adaptor